MSQWRQLGLCLGITFAALTAYADPVLPVDKVVIFGDSLSDNGNLYALTQWAHNHVPIVPVIPKEPYWQGRFSDGPIWGDMIIKAFTYGENPIPVLNYAYGGAWAEGVDYTHMPFPPDFGMEVDAYLAHHLRDDKSNTLYLIFMGANDYLMGRPDPMQAAVQVLAAEKKIAEGLILSGARNVVFMGLPDLGRVPRASRLGPWYSNNVHQLTVLHNEGLQQLVLTLTGWSDWFPNLRVSYLDVNAVMQPLLDAPQQYGFTDVTHACFGGWPVLQDMPEIIEMPLGKHASSRVTLPLQQNPQLATAFVADMTKPPAVCDDPNAHLFWDEVHPSSHANQLFAKSICGILANWGYGVSGEVGIEALHCEQIG